MNLPLIPVKSVICLPSQAIQVSFTRVFSVLAFNKARNGERREFFACVQRAPENTDIDIKNLNSVGVICRILQHKNAGASIISLVQGTTRARLKAIVHVDDCYNAEVEPVTEDTTHSPAEALEGARKYFNEILAVDKNATLSAIDGIRTGLKTSESLWMIISQMAPHILKQDMKAYQTLIELDGYSEIFKFLRQYFQANQN